jgi:hypothetical protein
MQMNRKALQQTKHVRRATHPAVTTLLNERKHLADVSHKAITIGIKLDDIDYSRKQADLIIAGMARFAIDSGMDANDPTVAQRITAALETVLNSVG